MSRGTAFRAPIVKSAHAVYPYSNAVKGNIDVKLNVTTR